MGRTRCIGKWRKIHHYTIPQHLTGPRTAVQRNAGHTDASCVSVRFDVLPRVQAGRLQRAGLPFDCQGDKYNCSVVGPLEIWVCRVLSRR